MTGAAHCQRCDWTTQGTPHDADRAAEAHTRKTGHPTATITTPGAATCPPPPAR
jgi:hypothetical protein